MNTFLTLVISAVEWIILLLFPLILLDYNTKLFTKRIAWLAVLMSVLSILLRQTQLPIFLVLALQMLVFVFLFKNMFRFKYLEACVITSMGYGFYALNQLLLLEIFNFILKHSPAEILFSNTGVTIILQTVSVLFVLGICYLLKRNKYQLTEFKHHLQTEELNKQLKVTIVFNTVLTFALISLVSLAMMVDIDDKHLLIILCIMLLLFILIVYFILHTQIRIKNLIEAKKFHLDKELQLTQIVEKLRMDATEHVQAIYKLLQKGALQLGLDYIEKHGLHQRNTQALLVEQPMDGARMDELLYAFLKNKQKMAQLLGVEIVIPTNIQSKIHISLRKVRYLSLVLDELILALYQAPAYIDKKINFSINSIDEVLHLEIACDIELEEQHSSSLKLFEAILQLKKENAIVHSTIKPVHLSITYLAT